MRTPASPPPGQRGPARGASRLALAVALGAAAALALSACGGAAAPAAAGGAATSRACTQIGAVLADGPDPDADPAGYAEAQILPLRQLRIPGQPLRAAVGQLDAAYQRLFASNGTSAAAARAVAAASKKVNAICPGAAS
jgi:hypothetical protein